MMLHDVIPLLEGGGVPANRRLWCYKLYNSIKKLYNFYKEQYLDKVNEDGEYVGKYYGFTSEYEFVAE